MDKKPKSKNFGEDIDKKASWMQQWRKRGIFWETVIVVGAIGWMVAVPMVVGGYLGNYLDRQFAAGGGGTSWTVTFIVLGLFVAAYSVWRVFIYKR